MRLTDSLVTRSDLGAILEKNNGVIIIKFTASWCGPCKKIEALVNQYFDMMPNEISTIEVDIDNGIDVYGFLRTKRVVNGIPVILAYYKNNMHYVPDDIVIGCDPVQIKLFFSRCLNQCKTSSLSYI